MRISLSCQNLAEICVEVDAFWQQTPIVNHYLHPADTPDWPNPWELISDNNYCRYARGLGMVYTLLLLGVKELDFVEALDDNKEHAVLVLVEKRYVLNYWPESVLYNKTSDFAFVKHISIEALESKIG